MSGDQDQDQTDLGVCMYSAAHAMANVPAVTVIDCGQVGQVPACQKCADFYDRMTR